MNLYGEDRENFSVIVNMEKGEIEIYQEMTVVEKVTDPITEILYSEALKEYDDLEIGDAYVKIINPESFGRRLINILKRLCENVKHVKPDSHRNKKKLSWSERAIKTIRTGCSGFLLIW